MATRVHEVTFERVEDAAAFMAAVSRKAAERSVDGSLCVEIELLAPGARVFLDDATLLLAELAFGPVPRVSLNRESLEHSASRMPVDLDQPSDMDEIVQRLSAHFHRLRDHDVA